jgi:hypothetical protein
MLTSWKSRRQCCGGAGIVAHIGLLGVAGDIEDDENDEKR